MQVDTSYSAVPIQPPNSPVPLDCPVGHRALIQAIKAVNLAELVGDKNILTFALDRETRRTVVRVVDRVTNAVVSQIPSEQLLRMAENLNTYQE